MQNFADMEEATDIIFSIIEDYPRADLTRGAKLFNALQDKFSILSEEDGYTVLVPSEGSDEVYKVNFDMEDGAEDCSCPANDKYFHCKHVPAAAYYLLTRHLGFTASQLNDMFDAGLEDGSKATPAAPKAKVINLKDYAASLPGWKEITAEASYLKNQIAALSRSYYADYGLVRNVKLLQADEQNAHWKFSVKDKTKIFTSEIRFDKRNTYHYYCTCKQTSAMCSHVQAVFEYVLNPTPDFFIKHKDWTAEKERLLQPYGIKPNDPDARYFDFKINTYGILHLKEPPFIWKKGAADKFNRFKQILLPQHNSRPPLPKDAFIDFEVGFLLNLASKHFSNGFELEPLKLIDKGNKKAINKLNLHQPDNHGLLKGLPDDVYTALTSLSDAALKRWVMQHVNNFYINNLAILGDKENALLQDYYFEQLQKLWPWLAQHSVYVLREGKFTVGNYHPATISTQPVKPCFSVTVQEPYININLQLQKGEQFYPADKFTFHNNFLIEIASEFHLPSADDRAVLMEFKEGFIRIHESDKAMLIRDIVPHLQKKYSVDVPESFKVARIELTPKPQLLLKEYKDQYLMLQPQFDYDGTVVAYEENPEDVIQLGQDGKLECIARNDAAETAFFESLRPLHPLFEKQTANDFFYLPFNEVMKNGWLLKTLPVLQEKEVPVLGIKDLKKFKYNTNTPKWEMKAGSGIDWFDLKVEISFGDQAVSLLEVRKAVMTGQNVVVLSDGTFGMLPEEWLKQYGMLLKMGDAQKDGTLRISKLHYTLIDELHGQIDDKQILEEIAAKKEKLRNIDNISTIKPSNQIKAKHRPYQLSGFQWMQVLDEVGWGGCLADDMGLGKTLQAITFLQYLKEKYTGSTHLVVCPTSLIYNWENELQKFAPGIKYHIHYGTQRNFSDEHFEQYDLVLTSYGVMRIDIEHLMQFDWHYVMLDESQAIKNPEAQVTKALQLIKSKNRLILSGTPVQNNTYDLFAQFNFINPGLLGNREFFKTEFANPIDKYNDAVQSSRLRRLVYPFLLRRTKEQVAPDLPDKTETILWCDMPKDQRSVYDHYKDYYRKMLLKKIEEEGMAKAGMYVLEGLLRLRQICDSPQLLKAPDVKTTTSIKTQELLREIKENTGQHKLLVFSQFTEMLDIIRKNMDNEGIAYCYLDGSTPAHKRQEAVEQFQTDSTYKVFLISLKAGGVGLNLTAADYVYIVDPWWNPAVEQQAIDRTHRIGQSQKIFAYKMICKGTVEEKILELQGRKKQLANDLITEDARFIKKLGKEDVAFLFS